MEVNQKLGVCFFKRTSFNVKSGRKIKFWDDDWLGKAEVWTPQGWNLTYIRPMHDWDVERLAEFYGTLDQYTEPKEGDDNLRWKCHNNGLFTVSSAYKSLNQTGSQNQFLGLEAYMESKNSL